MKNILLLTFISCLLACSDDSSTNTNCSPNDFISKWRGDVVCDSSSVNFQGFEFADSPNGVLFTYANFGIQNDFSHIIINCDFEAQSEWTSSNGKDYEVLVTGTLNSNKIEASITRKIDGVIDEHCEGISFEKY